MVKIVLFAVALSLSACASTQERFVREFSPQLKDGARPYAMQAASFGFAFMQGQMVQWELALNALEEDVPPFFAALEKSHYRAEYQVLTHPPKAGGAAYEWYGVDLVLVPRSGKGERFVIPGDEGTRMSAYARALVPATKATGIPAEVIRRGHNAIFALVTISGTLNATDDSMRRQAFGLLVIKDKLQRKEPNVDMFTAMRPPEQGEEDVMLALRVVADHHAATAHLRSETLALLALARHDDVPEARRALAEQISESRKRANDWRREHHPPTMEDFGVGMKELKLPTPENMLAVLDKDGYIAASIQIARGVATGNASATVDGFGKLAPANSSLRIAAEGTAAALRGDVMGTAKAVLALAEKQEDVAPIAARLRGVEEAVASARGALRDAKAAVSDPKGTLRDAAKR